jgi:hypothetical protein
MVYDSAWARISHHTGCLIVIERRSVKGYAWLSEYLDLHARLEAAERDFPS